MKELIIISGKGGTGKTSITGSFAALAAERAVMVDCDVDAADLHLILSPSIRQRNPFIGGKKARIISGRCIACGKCEELCRFDAIYFDGPGNGRVPRTFRVDHAACEGCGVCAHFCAEHAIEFTTVKSGQWFVSETRFGPMVHAQLDVAAENSGKLVTILRQAAQKVAAEQQRELILCDGAPGIGCSVIASLTGADLAMFVVEPTPSGIHDFVRVARLAHQLEVPGLLVINKVDLSHSEATTLQQVATQQNIPLVGRIPYDMAVVQAQLEARTIVEARTGPAAEALRSIWNTVEQHLVNAASVSTGPPTPAP